MAPYKTLMQIKVPGMGSFDIRRRAVQQTVKKCPRKKLPALSPGRREDDGGRHLFRNFDTNPPNRVKNTS
jgi:hypothetical protein